MLDILVTSVLLLHLVGAVCALYEYRKYVKLEKYAIKEGLEFRIRSKLLGYFIVLVFSWISYSALIRLIPAKKENTNG